MVTISIDVTLLEKARFKTITRKNGQKAVFADLILIDTPEGKYGDYIVKQQVTKEERAQKLEMPILGNGKKIFTGAAPRQAAPPATSSEPPQGDDVPF